MKLSNTYHRDVSNGRRVGTADFASAWSYPVSPEQVAKGWNVGAVCDHEGS